jgi:serine/threonine protein kinase
VRKNYDPLKADIWAFGIMLYWMALGYFPQDADKKKKINLKKW